MKSRITFLLLLLMPLMNVKSIEGIYNVKDFGALGDGVTSNTLAIQSAINTCAEKGGGKVVVPPGDYLTGPLFLRSNICIEVFPGAVLVFDDNIAECPIVDGRWEGIERKVYASLFTGHHLDNVTITGRGKIDGQGKRWWEAHYVNKDLREKHGLKGREPENPEESPLKVPRPRLINLYHCTNVLISELSFVDSPAWTIHPVYCENVTIEKISIIQPYESPNTDGINPESCQNVRILGCFVDCGDDCITIKSGYNEDGRRVGVACENIVISNCTFAHGRSAIGIGSEMSGDVRNISISNCVFNGTLRGIRIKTSRERGGVVENYRADNIVMNNVQTAISLDMYYGKKDTSAFPITEKTPLFRNIHLSNITAVNVENAAQITGLPEAPIADFSIVNSNFSAKKGFEVAYVKQFVVRDVKVDCEEGSPLTVAHGTDVEIDNFGTSHPLMEEPVIGFHNVSDAYIHDCSVKVGTALFLNAKEAEQVDLESNRLRGAKISY